MFIVKFQHGASGVRRASFDGALEVAAERAKEGDPSRVYGIRGGVNVLLAVVWVDGGIDYSPAGAQERG